jgi:hypothetical protein
MTDKEDDLPALQQQNICYIRLSTGDEVIGDCLGETSTEDTDYVVIKSPMLMSEVTNPFTQGTNVALSKYIPLGEFTVLPINRKDIVFILPVMKEMQDLYNSSVIYTTEFVDRHIRDELTRSTKAVNKAILVDYEEKIEGEIVNMPGKNVIIPSNTYLH